MNLLSPSLTVEAKQPLMIVIPQPGNRSVRRSDGNRLHLATLWVDFY